MVMRPALLEQERRLRLFLRRKEEARRLQLMRQLPDDLISHVLELADRRLAVQACQEAIRARQRIGKLLDNVLSARSMLTNVFCVRHGMVFAHAKYDTTVVRLPKEVLEEVVNRLEEVD